MAVSIIVEKKQPRLQATSGVAGFRIYLVFAERKPLDSLSTVSGLGI